MREELLPDQIDTFQDTDAGMQQDFKSLIMLSMDSGVAATKQNAGLTPP